MTQLITILGATGSIGSSTLDVVSRHPDRYQVYALTGHSRVEALFELAQRFQPQVVVVADAAAQRDMKSQLQSAHLDHIEVLQGPEGLATVASAEPVNMVMAAIVGAAGLVPTLAAAKAGKRVLLANKEALVMAGPLFMDAIKASGAELLPIDSEHNAIFQCMPGGDQGSLADEGIQKILLTASGGPFRGKTPADMAEITPAQAVAHPNWSMGAKISVDSASLMNKGLELIEACFLFDCQPDDIDVVVHPQSVIHSMVQYNDGSVLAQMGQPDMRTPIAYGMAWPQRLDSGVKPLDLFDLARLDFERPDELAFPCLPLAKAAFARGGILPAVLNAANEVAVAAFLAEQIPFLAIPIVIESVMARCDDAPAHDLEAVLAADHWARAAAESVIEEHDHLLAQCQAMAKAGGA